MSTDPRTITLAPRGGRTRHTARLRPLLGVILLLGGIVLAQGCDEETTTGPPPCAAFTPDEDPGAGKVVARYGDESICEEAVVELVATDVNDAFGLNTRVTYNASANRFIGFSAGGTVLGSDGATVVPLIQEIVSGQIEIGMDRISDTGVDITGTGLLVTLFFAPSGTGSGALTLEEGCLWGAGDPPAPLSSVTCSGGTLSSR